jgi:hypothetical protein
MRNNQSLTAVGDIINHKGCNEFILA